MSVQRVVALVLAVLCVVAIGLAGATIAQPETLDSGDSETAGVSDEGGGEQKKTSKNPDTAFPLLLEWPVMLILGIVFLVLAVGALVGVLSMDVEDFVPIVLVALIVFSAAGLWLWVGANPESFDPVPANRTDVTNATEESVVDQQGASEDESSDREVIETEWSFIVGLALLVTFVGVVVYGVTGRDTSGEELVEEQRTDDQLEAVGRAAGRAADQLDGDAEITNAVYEAWDEMTGPIDVEDPETSTPGEFALAATEAGVDPGDVDELTELFREVRYGDAPPSAEREQRAVETLRRIEDQFADASTADIDEDGSADGTGGGGGA